MALAYAGFGPGAPSPSRPAVAPFRTEPANPARLWTRILFITGLYSSGR
jgi:hypothetical protein